MVRTKYLHGHFQNRSPYRAMMVRTTYLQDDYKSIALQGDETKKSDSQL